MCSFGLAVNRRYQQNGEWKDADPVYLNVSYWGQPGEHAAASLSKGDRVMVVGRLEVRQYDKSDGSKGTSVDLIADEVAVSVRYAKLTVERVSAGASAVQSQPSSAAPYVHAAADPQYADEPPF